MITAEDIKSQIAELQAQLIIAEAEKPEAWTPKVGERVVFAGTVDEVYLRGTSPPHIRVSNEQDYNWFKLAALRPESDYILRSEHERLNKILGDAKLHLWNQLRDVRAELERANLERAILKAKVRDGELIPKAEHERLLAEANSTENAVKVLVEAHASDNEGSGLWSLPHEINGTLYRVHVAKASVINVMPAPSFDAAAALIAAAGKGE